MRRGSGYGERELPIAEYSVGLNIMRGNYPEEQFPLTDRWALPSREPDSPLSPLTIQYSCAQLRSARGRAYAVCARAVAMAQEE